MKKFPYLLLCIFLLMSCSSDSELAGIIDPIDEVINPDPNPNPNPNPGDLKIREVLVPANGFTIETHEIFAIWWDSQYNHSQDIASLKQWLTEIRQDVKNNLGFTDPPNINAGFYYNIYIHHGQDDSFPDFFGNGQGFDSGDLPYLALPFGAIEDFSNVYHEGFHVFQTSGGYGAIDTDVDSIWFIEASAEWYQCSQNSGNNAFITAGSVYANPHFSLWYIPEFWDPNVPADNDWLFGVRQYGVSSFLYFLSNVKSLDRRTLMGMYSNETSITAQEYLYNNLSESILRESFADWAVQTAVGFDYLTASQEEFTMNELNFFATSDEIKAHVLELDGSSAIGTFSPNAAVKPASWAYNSIKITNPSTSSYTFSIEGSLSGSDGATAHFEARVAVKGNSGIQYYEVDMPNGLSGQVTVPVNSSSEVYLVISSVPQHFNGFQTFDYSVTISN